ncbi:UNVERIFIED_CONTAM: Fruit protein [Sesamum angustifolium]|uniref:Fruit protein n=1 Tax=Sesamum angustifolium TaxID=2727405 RepID=A0AAW2RKN4_9LAMI
MTLSRLKPLRRLSHHLHRRSLAVTAAAVRQDTTHWAQTPLVKVSPAAESLFHISVDISDSPELATSYTKAGQYLQLRLQDPRTRPAFFAIASPPSITASEGVFEFLVKSIPAPQPRSFADYRKPIRSLIEAGFGADRRSDVRLYYGARNLHRMAYQERFKEWESSGVNIVPVLSQPDDSWKGERGYVQTAFARAKRTFSPRSTGALLCGHKQMAEEVTSVLVSDGVSSEKILKNF